jgi:hypothetical protein
MVQKRFSFFLFVKMGKTFHAGALRHYAGTGAVLVLVQFLNWVMGGS